MLIDQQYIWGLAITANGNWLETIWLTYPLIMYQLNCSMPMWFNDGLIFKHIYQTTLLLHMLLNEMCQINIIILFLKLQ